MRATVVLSSHQMDPETSSSTKNLSSEYTYIACRVWKSRSQAARVVRVQTGEISLVLGRRENLALVHSWPRFGIGLGRPHCPSCPHSPNYLLPARGRGRRKTDRRRHTARPLDVERLSQ